MANVEVFVCDYGTVRIGPVFSAALAECAEWKKARGMRRKHMRSRLDQIESCIRTLADVHWMAGKELREVP